MFKADICNRIERCGAMAIVRVMTQERAYEIAKGCLDGGIDVLEISYTLPNAGEIIRYLKEEFQDRLLVGAGTVLDSETARLAILAGAEFIIAPNYKQAVAECCNRYLIPYAPGCTSITEAMTALEMGASFIKAFPISNFYGPDLANVFLTPIPQMPLLASGGATLANLQTWLEKGVLCVGFGGLLTKGSSQEIHSNAAAIRSIIDSYRNPQAN
mgnify:CR=1 FL=1